MYWLFYIVHCRTGSLESRVFVVGYLGDVHCRTGSLETFGRATRFVVKRSLPHRQLRNHEETHQRGGSGSLPHRQLRNAGKRTARLDNRSLPHRQLRNCEVRQC